MTAHDCTFGWLAFLLVIAMIAELWVGVIILTGAVQLFFRGYIFLKEKKNGNNKRT